MASIVLRAMSATFDVEAFLQAHPHVVTDAVWQVGDALHGVQRLPRRRRRTPRPHHRVLADLVVVGIDSDDGGEAGGGYSGGP